MESRYQHTVNGQSVLQDDLNTIGEAASLADDRVFAELFRMAPYDGSDVSKGILPYALADAGNEQLVAPNGATGTVRVNPFRAFVGSRTAVASDAKENWRDIRSSIAVGSTTLTQEVSFGTAPPAGQTRWDLVYAVVSVDANAAAVARKVKDPTSKVVSSQNVVVTKSTTVTIGVVTGTASATPSFPSIPSDTGSSYYIPLAYVCLMDTYDASYTVQGYRIVHAAPVLAISRATSGKSVRVADQQYTPGGVVMTTAMQQELGSGGGEYPMAYLPSTMAGTETVFVALDLANVTTAFHSHANGDVIDSGDWRGRICFWSAVIGLDSNSERFPWFPFIDVSPDNVAFNGQQMFSSDPVAQSSNNFLVGAGQTMVRRFEGFNTGDISPKQPAVAILPSITTPLSGSVAVYCDLDDGGKLKLCKNGNPRGVIFLKLEFSAPFGSRST